MPCRIVLIKFAASEMYPDERPKSSTKSTKLHEELSRLSAISSASSPGMRPPEGNLHVSASRTSPTSTGMR